MRTNYTQLAPIYSEMDVSLMLIFFVLLPWRSFCCKFTKLYSTYDRLIVTISKIICIRRKVQLSDDFSNLLRDT